MRHIVDPVFMASGASADQFNNHNDRPGAYAMITTQMASNNKKGNVARHTSVMSLSNR
jgi:hypothetical protein